MRQASLALIVLLVVVSTLSMEIVVAQSVCTNPGTFNSANGSQYEYDAATNAYQSCLITTAPTSTPLPTPTLTPTATATPTLMPTPATVATQTGCNPYGDANLYQTCVSVDSNARGSINNLIFLPAIFFAILIIALLRWAH